MDQQPCRTAKEPLLPAAETASVSGILPPEFSRRTVEHYVAREWAIHLDDVMVRRTSWHYYLRDAAQKAERVADWMGELLGWSDAARAAEITRYHEAMNCQPLRSLHHRGKWNDRMITGLLQWFKPAPHIPRLPPAEVARLYPRYRWRIFEAAFIAYATFYVVRNNFSPVSKEIGRGAGITTSR